MLTHKLSRVGLSGRRVRAHSNLGHHPGKLLGVDDMLEQFDTETRRIVSLCFLLVGPVLVRLRLPPQPESDYGVGEDELLRNIVEELRDG